MRVIDISLIVAAQIESGIHCKGILDVFYIKKL